MMSGHGANPNFFNKKTKIGLPEYSLIPHLTTPLRPTASHFNFTHPPPPTPPALLEVDVTCVSP